MRRRSLLAGLCAGVAASLAGCARDAAPAVSLVPALVWSAPQQGAWTSWRGRELVLAPDATDGLWWLETPFALDDWEATQWTDVWSAPRALPAIGQANLVGKSESLRLSGAPAREVDADAVLRDPARLEHGDFALAGERVYLCAARATLEQPIALRTPLRLWSGAPGERRVGANGLRGSGLSLLSGQAIGADLARRDASELVFASATVALPGAGHRPNTLRVTLGGAELHVTQLASADAGALRWHRVALPPIGARGARLEFALDGDPACLFVLVPELRAAGAGARGAARERSAQPDVLVLLADTFRADLLSDYDAPVEVAPALEQLARESLVFEQCWSASTWTLPAHASLLSGLLPPQHGAVAGHAAMPKEPRMLAEHLHKLGYRTGAFTEGAYVSPEFGLARGFDVFDAAPRDVERTVDAALAFLDAADDRPNFLFVHSYRTHSPYRVSDAARAALRERLAIPDSEEAVHAAHLERSRDATTPEQLAAACSAYGRALEPLYRGGAWDLDHAFGRMLSEWDRRGFGARGVVVFTSDHGEALGEHAHVGHGVTMYEEVLRVPLLVRAHGRAAGRSATHASLVDLPRTICALAGLDPWPAWAGRDLVAGAAEARPVHAFECAPSDDTRMASIDGLLKLVVPAAEAARADARLLEAFDLAADRAELVSLLPGAEARCRDVWSRVRPSPALLAPIAPAAQAELDAALRRRLEDLGYLGR